MRGRGYGTAMLGLALNECKRLGIMKVLICCDKLNEASRRVIIKNGGVYENEVPEDGSVTERYWITLEE